MNTAVRQLHTAHISDEERQVRTDLAALHRLYVKFGWTDLIYTHLTARSPDNPNHYLIKPDDLLMEEVTASSLLKVDMEGNLISGDGPPNQAGHLIHTAVLGARPEINFSAHTHSRAGAAVSCMKRGVLSSVTGPLRVSEADPALAAGRIQLPRLRLESAGGEMRLVSGHYQLVAEVPRHDEADLSTLLIGRVRP